MSKLTKNTTTIAAGLAFAAVLSACSTFSKAPAAGTPLADVTAKLGKPTATYPDPAGGQVLEYRGQPMGQFQHMARIGADGRLVSYTQVLTNENFARIGSRTGPIARWTRDDVLREFGRPAEMTRARPTGAHPDDAEVWSYRYKDDGVWNSLMNVYFSANGVVLHTAKSADPVLDERFKGM